MASVLLLLSWVLAAAVAAAPAPTATYKGYTVTVTKAERRGNIKNYVGNQGTVLYAGAGHWLVILTVTFEGAPPATSDFVNEDRKAAIPRKSIVLLDKSANAPYFPSAWTGRSWVDWDEAAEQIKFNKEKTKATKQYLFRVDEAFDRSAAALKLDDQEVPVRFEK